MIGASILWHLRQFAPRVLGLRRAVIVIALLSLGLTSHAVQGASFEAWLDALRDEARSIGISEETLSEALQGLAPNQRVIELDRRQPEFTRTLDEYLAVRVSIAGVREGRAKQTQHRVMLGELEAKYGVPRGVMLAIWGMESGYGRHVGSFSVVRSLATLAWDERRSAFFRRELLAALRIADSGDVALGAFHGSWAGALGQPQLLPSVYLQHAQDVDGDGRRDIWTSVPDTLGSIAQVLRANGWKVGVPWGVEARVASDAKSLPAPTGQGCGAWQSHQGPTSVSEWSRHGVVAASRGLGPSELATLLTLENRHYLVTRSFEALLGYNCSNAYALAVGLLADGIAAANP